MESKWALPNWMWKIIQTQTVESPIIKKSLLPNSRGCGKDILITRWWYKYKTQFAAGNLLLCQCWQQDPQRWHRSWVHHRDARDVGNQELTDALIAPDGLMGVVFQPQVTAATEQGQTALLESLNTENKIEKRTAKKEKKETTSKAEPQTLEESFS